MTGPTYSDLMAALWATWPAEAAEQQGDFFIRSSDGGGKRVTAASLANPHFMESGIDQAEVAMRDAGRTPLFVVTEAQERLDTMLAHRGYEVVDATLFYVAPVDRLTERLPPRLSAFHIWPPLQIMIDIWADGGIGPDRVGVMSRAEGQKTALLGRVSDHPAGAGFVAVHETIAMLHALEIVPALRRRGLAGHMVAHAAAWAKAQGCTHLALAVTEANAGARMFYAGLGMAQAGGYQYRQCVPDDAP